MFGRAWPVRSGERKRPPGFADDRRSFTLTWGRESTNQSTRIDPLNPPLAPSKEGSSARWIVPLLGGVRGGWVGGRFMGRAGVRASVRH